MAALLAYLQDCQALTIPTTIATTKVALAKSAHAVVDQCVFNPKVAKMVALGITRTSSHAKTFFAVAAGLRVCRPCAASWRGMPPMMALRQRTSADGEAAIIIGPRPISPAMPNTGPRIAHMYPMAKAPQAAMRTRLSMSLYRFGCVRNN